MTTHRESHTPLHNTWLGMKVRCFDANHSKWNYYGGRGITVCDEWRSSYETFRDWALANGYRKGLTLDRIDVNGNYCPENCRWATRKEQARNRRSNVFYKGKCIAEWCEILGIDPRTVNRRVRAGGWPLEKALFTPVRKSLSKDRL